MSGDFFNHNTPYRLAVVRGSASPRTVRGLSDTGWRQHTWCLHLVYNVQTFCERSFINVDQKSGVHTVTFGEISHPQNPPNVVKFSRWQLQLTVLWRHKLFPSLTHSSHTVLYGTQSSAPPAAGTCLFCGPFYFWMTTSVWVNSTPKKSNTVNPFLSLQLPIFPSELDMLSICILKSFMISSIFIISC